MVVGEHKLKSARDMLALRPDEFRHGSGGSGNWSFRNETANRALAQPKRRVRLGCPPQRGLLITHDSLPPSDR
jgi:hypothetical protein